MDKKRKEKKEEEQQEQENRVNVIFYDKIKLIF